MNPLPKTPTPGKFLPSRRSTQSSQTPGGPPRFTPTPRFGVSSATRPATQRAGVDIIEDDEEEYEIEYDSASEEAVGSERASHEMADDAIDVGEPDWSAIPLGREREGDGMRIEGSESEDEERETPREREAKRRKVSISPVSQAFSPLPGADDEAICNSDGGASWELSGSESQGSFDEDLRGSGTKTAQQQQQPVFQPAPRFKPVETDDAHGGLVLPESLFSPQRRGAKYVAGGLAAQLQGWLSEVKGWESSDQDATDGKASLSLRIHTEEVRPGRRMCFLEGCVLSEGSPTTTKRRFILAGEGRLTGLGEKTEVKKGSVVVVGQPTWDVEVDGHCWTVACDWGVEA